MSSLYEFYKDKEIRELTNAINSAKYISEDQKEAMIEGLLGKGSGILGRVTDADRKKAAEVEKNNKYESPTKAIIKKHKGLWFNDELLVIKKNK